MKDISEIWRTKVKETLRTIVLKVEIVTKIHVL